MPVPQPKFNVKDRVRVTQPGPDFGLVGTVVEVQSRIVAHYIVEFNGVHIARFPEFRLRRAEEVVRASS